MLSLSPTVHIFVYSIPTDMRRQFDGLSTIVTHALGKDVFTGDYFVFLNRSRTMCKILTWDRDGFLLLAKRLARGRFQSPANENSAIVSEIDAITLSMILSGIELTSAKRRKRYQRSRELSTSTSRDAHNADMPPISTSS